MKGSVFKRCPCGISGGGGNRGPACRKDHGSWWYVTDIGPGPNGKRQQEKRAGFLSRDEAEAALAAVIKGVTDGTHTHDERQTVATFLDEWIATKVAGGLRITTARSYQQHIRDHIKPHIGHLRLRDLRPGHVTGMLRKIGAHRVGDRRQTGPSTVRRVHATLRSALAAAVRLQLVAFNAAANVTKDLPAAARPKVRPWEPEELGKFLDYAVRDARMGALIELAAATGMRRGEVCGLRWADVDLAQGVLVVHHQLVQLTGKEKERPDCPYCPAKHRVMFGPVKTASGEERRVELDTGTVGVLLAHQMAQQAEKDAFGEAYADHGLVFAREDGMPIVLDTVTKRFRELAKEAGVRLVRFHDLRHGAASLRLATGTDIAVVSKVLGHSSVAITSDTYSHLLAGVGKASAERANGLVPRAQRDQSVTTDEETAAGEDQSITVSAGQDGGPPETRTRNLRIKSRPPGMTGGADR